jgi:haloalkane dehalogenase
MDVLKKKFVSINGRRMAYVEDGVGDPIVFLHGNPTSSYLWRNILPHLAKQGRCIAPDLIGMGDSEKLPDSGPGSYDFAMHSAYLDEFMLALNIREHVTLVVHDWGSALGFNWARRHPDAIKGIVYMEAIVRPVSWDEWPEPSQPLFRALRSKTGEELILQKNIFVERILPASIQRKLTDAEMAAYRLPFAEPGEARRPTLDWPRQLPIDNEPEDVCALVSAYAEWMSTNNLPKLFIIAKPGAILVGPQREFCRLWPNQSEVTVNGIHFIQEDSAAEIGAAISTWLRQINI